MGKKSTLLFVFSMVLAFVGSAQVVNFVPSDSSVAPLNFSFTSPASISGLVLDFETVDFWNPTLSSSLSAEFAWGRTIAGDSIACDSIATDLTGKIALIRRGDCTFVQKAENALAKGAVGFVICNNNITDPDEVIGMGGAAGSRVEIPGAFLSFNTCTRIALALDAGETVVGGFSTQSLHNGTIYSYASVPKTQTGLPNFITPQANYFNYGVDSIFTATLTATYPDGTTEEVGTTLDTIQPMQAEPIAFPGAEIKLTQGVGEYQYTVTSSLPNVAPYTTSVNVTEDYYGNASAPTTRAVAMDNTAYDGISRLQYIGLLVEAENTVEVLSYNFGICNAAEMTDANGVGPLVEAYIFDADFNDDGVRDIQALTDLESFNRDSEIAFAEYEVTGNEICAIDESSQITLQFTSSTGDPKPQLKAGKEYVVVILIDGNDGTRAEAPRLLATASENQAYNNVKGTSSYFSSFLQTTQLFQGFAGVNIYQQLNVSDEVVTTRQVLGGQLILAPNPANQASQLRYSLQNAPENGIVEVFSMTGQKVHSQLLFGSRAGTMDLPVDALPVGMYNVRISTDAGERTLPLQVVR